MSNNISTTDYTIENISNMKEQYYTTASAGSLTNYPDGRTYPDPVVDGDEDIPSPSFIPLRLSVKGVQNIRGQTTTKYYKTFIGEQRS